VLDAWTLMAVLRAEPAARRARQLVRTRMVMSSVNLGEVYYVLMRSHGTDLADERTTAIRRTVQVEDPDWPLIVAAARLKAAGGLSYADAFCVATAQRHGVPVYTGDPEILALDVPVRIVDLRST
jgi:PIN domain nuclease of toxin-antitoxin system